MIFLITLLFSAMISFLTLSYFQQQLLIEKSSDDVISELNAFYQAEAELLQLSKKIISIDKHEIINLPQIKLISQSDKVYLVTVQTKLNDAAVQLTASYAIKEPSKHGQTGSQIQRLWWREDVENQ